MKKTKFIYKSSTADTRTWWLSLGLVSMMFLLSHLVATPLLHSGDDVFLLYTLAGGYGEAPNNLLHYNYGWHPILGWCIKELFRVFPELNWYSVFLLLLQVMAYTIILAIFGKRFGKKRMLLFSIILFLMVGIRMQLFFNYSITAWVLSIAGLFLIIDHAASETFSRINYLLAFLVLLLAGLLRLHMLFMVAFLSVPFLYYYAAERYLRPLVFLAIVFGLHFFLTKQQENYYKATIPGWEQQEEIRQSLFDVYNYPNIPLRDQDRLFANSVEQTFYTYHFLYDSSVVNQQRIKELEAQLTRYRDFSVEEDYQRLLWLFKEQRVYLLFFVVGFFLILYYRMYKGSILWLLFPFLLVLASFLVLVVFVKTTSTVSLGLIFFLFLYSFYIFFRGEDAAQLHRQRFPLAFLLLLLPLTWAVIRVWKENDSNKNDREQFECFAQQLQKHPNQLFVAMDDRLPFPYFYAWNSPVDFPMENFINKDRCLTNSYQPTLRRFDSTRITDAILQNEKVLLVGRVLPDLKSYYRIWYGRNITIEKQKGYPDCFRVSRVISN
jgi:MFS family permease